MKILWIIVAIVAVLLIVAAFLPRTAELKREIVINAPKQAVFDYVKLLKNQPNYNVRVMKDPNKKQEFIGTDGTVGFINTWDGNSEAGKGEQEIKSMVEWESMDVEVRFERPMKSVGLITTIVESVDASQTKIANIFKSSYAYPMNLLIPLVKWMLEKDMEKTLNNLKVILEK